MANGEAIGLIETKGIVAAVEACDAALKAANVEFVGQLGGAPADPARSRELLARAAETNAEAQYQLGLLLAEGTGGEKDDVGRAVLYGSRPPKNDSLWASAERHGFEVIVYDRNAANKEKKIDTQITADMIEDSYDLVVSKLSKSKQAELGWRAA